MELTVETLNYHHLLYFWVAAREGSVVKAAERLMVSQPTISAQIKALEAATGCELFMRRGRGLALTDAGQTVLRYANDTFGTGRQMLEALRQHPVDRPLRLAVGIADGLPKLVTRTLLEPALGLGRPVRLLCREGRMEVLLLELAAYRVDAIFCDAPIGTGVQVKTFTHDLGESPVAFFAGAALAKKLRRGFPQSLDRAPVYLPTENAAMRVEIDQWFMSIGVMPEVIGEFEDSALLKTFAQSGRAAFPTPLVVENEVCRQYGVRRIGVADSVRERYFAITAERKLRHPAVAAILEEARKKLLS